MHHRQLTAAAQEIGVTQSALSHALRRLSSLLGEPIFYRTRNGMQPTRFAEAIAPQVAAVLNAAETAFGPGSDFSPTPQTTFRIAMVGETAALFAASMGRITAVGEARLELMHTNPTMALSLLLERKCDMALSPGILDDARLERLLVMSTPWIVASRREHPVLTRKKDMSLKKYMSCRHIAINSPDPDVPSYTLLSAGLERHVAAVAPNALTALQMAAETDLLATVPKAIAQPLAKTHNLRLMPSPLDIPPYAVYAFWLKARESEPMLSYLKRYLDKIPEGADDKNDED